MPARQRCPSQVIALASAVRPAIAAVVLGFVLVAGAGCTSSHTNASSGSLNSPSIKTLTPSAAAATNPQTQPTPGSASTPTATPSSQPLPAGAISAKLSGIPPTIKSGGPAIEFTATLTNHSTVSAANIAPLFQIVGGPCNCVQGTLQRFDPTTGTWNSAPMPEGDGDPNYLATASGGVQIPPGTSVTIRYRLSLSAVNPAKPLAAILYAVALPMAIAVAHTTAPSQLIAA
jgi:hypothetical protein